MNLYWRLLLTILQAMAARRREKRAPVLQPQRLRLRCYANDLDFNGHMNNGRYLTLMDLGRLHLMMRTGLMEKVLKEKLAPTLAAVQIRYRMQLLPWQMFELESRVLCWDEKWIYMEQRFLFASGPKKGAVAAIGLVKGAFYDRRIKTTVPSSELLTAVGMALESPPFPDYVREWVEAEEALRGVTA